MKEVEVVIVREPMEQEMKSEVTHTNLPKNISDNDRWGRERERERESWWVEKRINVQRVLMNDEYCSRDAGRTLIVLWQNLLQP